MKLIQTSFVFVILCIAAGTALECYDCDSTDCGNDGYDTTKKICDLTEKEKEEGHKEVCGKVVGKVYEVIFTQRGCARSSDFGNSCDGVKSLSLSRPFAVQHCSICETNLCNGSEKLITFNWIAVHLSFIIYHWFSLQDDDLNNK